MTHEMAVTKEFAAEWLDWARTVSFAGLIPAGGRVEINGRAFEILGGYRIGGSSMSGAEMCASDTYFVRRGGQIFKLVSSGWHGWNVCSEKGAHTKVRVEGLRGVE